MLCFCKLPSFPGNISASLPVNIGNTASLTTFVRILFHKLCSLIILSLSLLYFSVQTKKEPSPRLLCPQKQSFEVHRQGLEPWTP